MTDLQSPRKMGLILELWKHPFDISNLASSTFHYLDMWTTYELLTSKPVFLKAWPRNNFMSITLECLFKLAILKPQPRSRESESVRRDLGISILKQRLQAIFHTRIWEPLILVLLQVFSFPENHWGSLLQLGATSFTKQLLILFSIKSFSSSIPKSEWNWSMRREDSFKADLWSGRVGTKL